MKGDKWNEAMERAGRFDGTDVIYCISFAHGLMKVGRTGAMGSRLRSYDSHGPTRLLLALEYWKNAAMEARIERDELRFEKAMRVVLLDVFDEHDTCDAFCGLPVEYLTQNV